MLLKQLVFLFLQDNNFYISITTIYVQNDKEIY